MTGAEFAFIRAFVKERSGLYLADDKRYLVETRLIPIAERHGLSGLPGLVAALSRVPGGQLSGEVVDAMTTNESSFFRDRSPFEGFRDVMLPALRQSRSRERKVRIWSAAASTGQEAYSLAMAFEESALRAEGWQVDILATDISASAMEQGKAGRYSQFEVQRGMPAAMLVKYFKQEGETWSVCDTIRRRVAWKYFNLLDSFAPLGRFDIIFCRNVLIYFDAATKSQVLDRLSGALAPDGYLVLGGAETVVGLSERFRVDPLGRGLYRHTAFGAEAPMARAAAG